MLKAALIGLPQVGKSTLFGLLTAVEARGGVTLRGERKVVAVPDERLEVLAEMFRPRRVTPAQLEVMDLPPLVRGSSEGEGLGNRFLVEAREADALVHVLRAFSREDVAHVEGSLQPLRDLGIVEDELILADLEVVERRLERLRGQRKRDAQAEKEAGLLERCREALYRQVPVRALSLSEEESRLLRGFALLTAKPRVYVVNGDEGILRDEPYPGKEELAARAAAEGTPLVAVSAQVEEEIAALAPEDRGAFLAELGVRESGLARLSRAAYEALGLISFLTAGEDEVRAWTVARGTRAREAAGKIHSDLERGFIRAEVVAYADLVAAGSLARARERGLLRLEGKDYVVQDGDVITFRFHV